ncbi:MAG: hypothetical protein RBT71_05985 [Flavobacteriales bacterium]|jgi:hypothetical protein|nr:hypothetical protein [Flavobacteriales bacterium]
MMLYRTLNTLLLLTIAAMSAMAQTTEEAPMRTLLGGEKKLHHGGWGALTTHHTRIMDQDALLLGARGAWLINHRISIGIGGHGLLTPVFNNAYDAHLIEQGEVPLRRSSLYMGYGGLLIEPVIAYRSPVHITLPVIVGAGGVTYGHSGRLPEDADALAHEVRYDAQAFFVVEPGIELEMNIIPLVRVGIGASYRYTSDLDLPATPKDALHGLSAGISVKVGAF